MDASGRELSQQCSVNMTSQTNHLQLHHRLFHLPAHIQVQSLIIAMFLFWYIPDGMIGREVELRQDGERGGRHGEREREGIFNPLRHRPFAGRPRSLGLHNAISTSEVIKAVWRMPGPQ